MGSSVTMTLADAVARDTGIAARTLIRRARGRRRRRLGRHGKRTVGHDRRPFGDSGPAGAAAARLCRWHVARRRWIGSLGRRGIGIWRIHAVASVEVVVSEGSAGGT
jgi:hypothetical protein